ncbi:porin [Caenimonas terrae]|uniref:Porin n=1 Tax=Caenimonas terrae TaxID=696074 RepID=A0ABW0N5J4_9BURK
MKNVFVLSAIALACGGAMAQSSVTLSGIVDVNVQRFDSGSVGKATMVGNGGLSTSRLVFRGTEDLGGGLYAGFWLEGSINPDTGEGRNSNLNNQPSGAVAGTAGTVGFKFDRQSYVSLGTKSLGELRMGHDFIPTHWNSIYFDPFNANGVARAGNLTFAGVTTAPLPSAITASNSVSYWLPANLGGVYGLVMVAAGENSSNAANAHDGNLAGFRLGYAAGPFDVAVAMTRTRNTASATIGDYTHANVGGTYNAGFAKFFALYNTVKVKLSTGDLRKDTMEVGAHIPVGPAGRIRLSYAVLDDRSAAALTNANGSARSSNDVRQWGIGYVHDLSKRTALYGTYASMSNRGQAAYALSGGRAPLPGEKTTGLEVGIRHSF